MLIIILFLSWHGITCWIITSIHTIFNNDSGSDINEIILTNIYEGNYQFILKFTGGTEESTITGLDGNNLELADASKFRQSTFDLNANIKPFIVI